MNKNSEKINKLYITAVIDQTRLKIFNYVIDQILKTIKGSAYTGAFIQCFCLIDYLSEMVKLNRGNNKVKGSNHYKEFLAKYFKTYNKGYLWAIRCCLVHSFGTGTAMEDEGLGGYMLQHINPENHKKIITKIPGDKPTYWLNLSNFVFDTIKATFAFFSDLEKAPLEEQGFFIKRVERIISVIDTETGMEVMPYKNGKINPILYCLDFKKNPKHIKWDILKEEILKIIKNPI